MYVLDPVTLTISDFEPRVAQPLSRGRYSVLSLMRKDAYGWDLCHYSAIRTAGC